MSAHCISKGIAPKLSLLSAILCLLALSPKIVQGATFTVLYRFTGGADGGVPISPLTFDSQGNLYGTATYGGAYGYGTVFKLTPSGTETVLHSFAGYPNDGNAPSGRLVFDGAGNLYGTTQAGGANIFEGGGGGTVFKIAPDGTETVLYSFCSQNGCTDGVEPVGGLVLDAKGNLYGTTYHGGTKATNGTLYRVASNGTFTVLHSFGGYPDGAEPSADLIIDTKGILYGTTDFTGGLSSGYGTIFSFTPGGQETVLHTFAGPPGDGAGPQGLLLAADGNFYGVTYGGGPYVNSQGISCGTIFRLAPGGAETVLYNFCANVLSTFPFDGNGLYGSPVMDAAGNLYGTTSQGGISFGGINGSCKFIGCGAVFKLTPGGKEVLLHRFTGGLDGGRPEAGLVADSQGNLYGTADEGGNPGCNFGYGCGVVFKLTP